VTARRLATAEARKRLRHCRAFELATIARQTPPTSPRFRPMLENLVEELIAYLDADQPDHDLEDDEREDDDAERGIADHDALQELRL
jgi:hypothetical protein